MFKRNLILKLVITTLVSMIAPATMAENQIYSDVLPTDAVSVYLEKLTDLNVISGYPDGTFRPHESINRAEFMKMIIGGIFDDEVIFPKATQQCFPDIVPYQWYTGYVCHAKDLGILRGYLDGTFRPEQNINAAEALKVIFLSYGIQYDTGTTPWYKGAIDHARNEYHFNTEPGNYSTRGEVATILAKILWDVAPIISIENKEQPMTPEKNLETIFETRPTQEEIDKIMEDFDIEYIDSDDEKWPEEFTFDQTSTEPSKMVIISHLNVLRQQEFSEPLPFTEGLSIYDYVKKYTKEIDLYLECESSTGGAGKIDLYRGFNIWDIRLFNDCFSPLSPLNKAPYVSGTQLIVHENAHNRPYLTGDPGHHECLNYAGDYSLENGSGYAQGAIYSMWVYKYGVHDSGAEKIYAKNLAKSLLGGRFCTPPTHPNPKVQAIVDELMAEIEAER